MKKIFLFLLILTVAGFSQQLNHTWGVNIAGNELTKLTYIDTTAATTNEIYVDLDDYYFVDWYPLTVTSADTGNLASGGDSTFAGQVSVYSNSDRQYIGTFYVSFDNQGSSAATDSLAGYTIKATPGVYTTSSKSIAAVDWGTAITLETVRQAGDYLAVNNVYIHSTAKKVLPPQILRLQVNAPATSDTDMDDSTEVSWDFVYPAIYHVHEVQKP